MGAPKSTTVRFSIYSLVNCDQYNHTELGLMFDVDPNSIIRYKNDGLTHLQADRLATRISRHPAEVWPDYNEDLQCISPVT